MTNHPAVIEAATRARLTTMEDPMGNTVVGAVATAREPEPKPQPDGAIGCTLCIQYEGKFAPSHNGSPFCRCGSLASGGHRAHCSCDTCF